MHLRMNDLRFLHLTLRYHFIYYILQWNLAQLFSDYISAQRVTSSFFADLSGGVTGCCPPQKIRKRHWQLYLDIIIQTLRKIVISLFSRQSN